MFSDSRTCLVECPQKNEGSWWKRRTNLEKKLFILVFILLFKCAIFAATFCCLYFMYRSHSGFFGQEEKSNPAPPLPTAISALSTPHYNDEVCLTPGCVSAAATIINNMNPEELPCEDFYEYACGGFIETNHIPDTKRRIGQFAIVAEDLSQQIKDIIDSPVNEEGDSELLIKMKHFYTSCMNETKIAEIGLKPLVELIDSVGSWPVLLGDQWNDTDFQWQELMFRFKDVNLSPNSFISFGVSEDLVTNKKHILTIFPPSLSLPKEYYKEGMNHSYVKTYYDYLIKSAIFFGADAEVAKKDMNDVLQFETELSHLLRDSGRVSNISKLYMTTNLSELQVLVPEMNWKEYMERILPFTFEEDEELYLFNQNYTLNFTRILNKTSARTLANFAVGRIARSLAPIVSEDFAQLNFKSFKKLTGVKTRSARWRNCLGKTRNIFSVAISHEYIKEWFTPEEKEQASEMVKLIKEEMHEMLKNVNWVDPETLKNALDKLSVMDAIVAYPDEVLDYDKVAQIYENFTVDNSSYFQNIRNYQILMREKHFSKLREPVKKHDWKKSAAVAVVNAFYSPLENMCILPVGILQGVFFDYERPAYMNFASIGTIIGHEITHGFDDKGRQFDKNGSLKNWWKPETSKKFKELAQCMIEQYDGYWSPEVDMKMNGKNCLGENIADNGGLKNAYNAYQRWVQEHGSEPTLPGLNLTTNQLFWMSYANVWCYKARPQSIADQIQFGVHTINRFRVNGPLSNTIAFARDFNCPVNSTMNPEKRCAVW